MFSRSLPVVLLALLVLRSASGQDEPASADSLVRQAETAYKSRQFEKSVRLYQLALQRVEETDRAGVEYNLACVQALAGDRNSAFTTLDHAVEDGYSDRMKGAQTIL